MKNLPTDGFFSRYQEEVSKGKGLNDEEQDMQLKSFSLQDEESLLAQAKRISHDRVIYECVLCEKSMFTKRGFIRHIRVHSGKKPCLCETCGNRYRVDQDLTRHIREVHEGLRPYACDLCSKAFASKSSRDDHRRIHTGEKPHTCAHCLKSFRTLNLLYVHNRIHTGYKPHLCSFCGKRFRNKQTLDNHITVHTGVKNFSCGICGRRFSVKGEVVRHQAIHSDEKPFVCSRCGIAFGQKRYLKNHIILRHKKQSDILLAELRTR